MGLTFEGPFGNTVIVIRVIVVLGNTVMSMCLTAPVAMVVVVNLQLVRSSAPTSRFRHKLLHHSCVLVVPLFRPVDIEFIQVMYTHSTLPDTAFK